jgi:hypothetical protein
LPRGQLDGSLRSYSELSRPEPLLFYQVAPQLYSRGSVDPVLRKCGRARNRTRDPWICSQEHASSPRSRRCSGRRRTEPQDRVAALQKPSSLRNICKASGSCGVSRPQVRCQWQPVAVCSQLCSQRVRSGAEVGTYSSKQAVRLASITIKRS